MIMVSRQRITQTSGSILYDDTAEEALLMFDTNTDITDPIEIIFPENPIEGQMLGITTRRPITDLTLTSQYYPITEKAQAVDPAAPVVWFFSTECGRWFRHP